MWCLIFHFFVLCIAGESGSQAAESVAYWDVQWLFLSRSSEMFMFSPTKQWSKVTCVATGSKIILHSFRLLERLSEKSCYGQINEPLGLAHTTSQCYCFAPCGEWCKLFLFHDTYLCDFQTLLSFFVQNLLVLIMWVLSVQIPCTFLQLWHPCLSLFQLVSG